MSLLRKRLGKGTAAEGTQRNSAWRRLAGPLRPTFLDRLDVSGRRALPVSVGLRFSEGLYGTLHLGRKERELVRFL